MRRRLRQLGIVVVLAIVVSGCAAGRAYRRGDVAMRAGDLDQAVAHYRLAVQADPDNPNYKIALERAMLAASRAHFQRAREFEEQDQLEAARSEYRLASEYDSSNRQAAAKVASLEQIIRDRIEASRPRPPIDALRERARAAAAPPILNPAAPIVTMTFNNQQIGQILDFLGESTGINIQYDSQVNRNQGATVRLDGVSFEQALNQILSANQLAYKVLNERSILVFRDDPASHARYDDVYVQTFYISHGDPTDLTQILSNILRLPQGTQYMVQPNKGNNTIIVRGTRAIVDIIGKLIEQNDKPRAEIVFDLEILEVDRARVKQYGLNLSEFAIGGIFSPEVSPSSTTTTTPPTTGTPGTGTTTTTNTGRSTPPSGVGSPPPFNLNTITQGVNTADFYAAVPTAVVRFLESDTNTKLIAKPSLRGTEGTKLTLNLGEEIPIVTTSYTPIATGGVGVNPLNSFQLKSVGINLDITPRVTVEGDILIELNVENSSRGPDVNVAGTNYPSFGSRRVSTRLRLRDGESNLLAGLLREDERRSLQGFPGAIHVPLLKQLFSSNDQTITQTDIVMLLTPHIVRTHGITEDDLRPVYIGTQGNLSLGGPPPLIAMQPEPALGEPAGIGAVPPPTQGPTTLRPPAASAGAPSSTQLPVPGGATLAPPPGSTPVPGAVVVPAQPPATVPQPAAPAVPPPDVPGPQAAAPPPATLTNPPFTSSGFGAAQILLMPPATTFRVGGGPYTVPINVTNAARLSTVTMTLTYDPAVLRLRSVQEGAFMRSGGANATFTQQVGPGRVDITIVRSADATGASGSGILAAVLFDAAAPGSATLSLNGAATGPGGTPMGLQFRPVVITVQ